MKRQGLSHQPAFSLREDWRSQPSNRRSPARILDFFESSNPAVATVARTINTRMAAPFHPPSYSSRLWARAQH